MDTLIQHPPYYVKHKTREGYSLDGPFVTLGSAQSFAVRCEYSAKGIEWEIVGLEEKNAYEAETPVPEEEVHSRRGPGRPRKEKGEE